MNIKRHTLPDESITQAMHHRFSIKDTSKYYFHCTESFFFDHEGKREVVHLNFYTNLDGAMDRKREMRVEVSRLDDYNRDKGQYENHMGTSSDYVSLIAEKKGIIELYRSIREQYLKDNRNGWYYKN